MVASIGQIIQGSFTTVLLTNNVVEMKRDGGSLFRLQAIFTPITGSLGYIFPKGQSFVTILLPCREFDAQSLCRRYAV